VLLGQQQNALPGGIILSLDSNAQTQPPAFPASWSCRDVFPLAYQPPVPTEGAAVATAADGSADPTLPAPYTCPITEARCDRHPFVALVPCGHVFAGRALREAGKDGTCPSCSTAFAEEDVVPLLPSEEQEERLRELLPGRRKQAKRRRKGGKGEKRFAHQSSYRGGRPGRIGWDG